MTEPEFDLKSELKEIEAIELEHEFELKEIEMYDIVNFLRKYIIQDEAVDIVPHVYQWSENAITLLYSSGKRTYRLVANIKFAVIFLLNDQLKKTGVSQKYFREWQAFMVEKIGRPYAEKFNILVETQRFF